MDIHPGDTILTNKHSEFRNPFWLVLLTLAIVLACMLDYVTTRLTKKAKLANKIPGAPLTYVPFIGNVGYFVFRTNLKEAITDYLEKYGRVCRLWKFGLPIIFIGEGKAAETLLHNADLYEKGDDNWAVKEFLGNGLVTGSGLKVRHERKLLNPGFNRQLFDGFLDVFNKESRKLLEILDNKFKNLQQTSHMNIHPDILRCSLEIVFQTSLGKEMHIQNEGETKGFVEAFAIGSRGMHLRFFKPWMTLPIIIDILGIRKEEEECMKFIRTAILGALYDRRDARQNGTVISSEGKTKPFIDVLLDVAGDNFSEQDFFDHLISIGSDTISNAINFSLFLMANYPEYQKRVHEEIDAVFWGEMDRDVTMADLAELRYLEMCLKESLRIYPPIPLMSRKMLFNVKLENGLTLPKGSDAVFLIYDVHRDPAIFPDPEVYDPERFAPDAAASRSQGCFIPFGTGLRNCIGQKFALMEARVVLAHLLRHFEVSSPQRQTDIKFLYGVPVEPHPSIKLHLKRRSAQAANKEE
ncbi:Cytochrome P450 4C1 [Folsomia candida]|uniref:Cytochrome P450 4C1 n=1 Tax=Folsomia candida TaxID=158441 RepID=A0A226ENJ9_FOLCA|nr:Cytochrome P450 4C1 [Folsomia candida]